MNDTFTWLIGLHIPSSLLPVGVLTVFNVVLLALLAICLRCADWKSFIATPGKQHVLFAAMVMLLLIWGLKAGISPGLGYHHLGATIFTLMFGWPFAIISLSMVLVISLAAQQPDWLSVGVNGVISIAVPVLVSHSILRLSEKHLPDNFFIYIFVVAFFGAGLAVACSRLGATLLLYMFTAYPDTTLINESIRYLPLFMFPEAFVTGMLISVFVVYRPQWVVTFDDDRYIKGK